MNGNHSALGPNTCHMSFLSLVLFLSKLLPSLVLTAGQRRVVTHSLFAPPSTVNRSIRTDIFTSRASTYSAGPERLVPMTDRTAQTVTKGTKHQNPQGNSTHSLSCSSRSHVHFSPFNYHDLTQWFAPKTHPPPLAASGASGVRRSKGSGPVPPQFIQM